MTTALLYMAIALSSFGVFEDPTVQAAPETVEQAPANSNETYINRLKTSDKHQKAVLDYVKG